MQPPAQLYAIIQDPEFLDFLQNQIPHSKVKERERSIFEVGGRGYYENTASDLLAFFLQPEESHHLGTLFLESYISCLNEPALRHNFALQSSVTISREQPTQQGGRMDIEIKGADWYILIENKIRHIQNNPWDEYERHARLHHQHQTLIFSVLSPEGTAPQVGSGTQWRGVSYRDFCNEVSRRLDCSLPEHAHSKWYVFAKEFILHLRNETSPTLSNMTPEQIQFVESNSSHIEKALQLKAAYRAEVIRVLSARLTNICPESEVSIRDEGWAFRIKHEKWKKSDYVVIPGDSQYVVRFYAADFKDSNVRELNALLLRRHYIHNTEGVRYNCYTSPKFKYNIECAADELYTLIKITGYLFDVGLTS